MKPLLLLFRKFIGAGQPEVRKNTLLILGNIDRHHRHAPPYDQNLFLILVLRPQCHRPGNHQRFLVHPILNQNSLIGLGLVQSLLDKHTITVMLTNSKAATHF